VRSFHLQALERPTENPSTKLLRIVYTLAVLGAIAAFIALWVVSTKGGSAQVDAVRAVYHEGQRAANVYVRTSPSLRCMVVVLLEGAFNLKPN
jgi:P pilus assembly chaperone PapD